MYHKTLTECLRRIKAFKDLGEEKKIAIMVASHNEDTVRFAIQKMKEFGIEPEDKVICFGQLLAMCDYITFPLGEWTRGGAVGGIDVEFGFRSEWGLGLQIYSVRACQRGAAVPVQKGPREQGRAEEDQEGEEVTGERDPKAFRNRKMVVHTKGRLHPCLKVRGWGVGGVLSVC